MKRIMLTVKHFLKFYFNQNILQSMIRKKSLAYLKSLSRKAKLLRLKKRVAHKFTRIVPTYVQYQSETKYQNVQTLDFHKIADQNVIFSSLASRRPFLLINGSVPSFTYPKRVKVIATKLSISQAEFNPKIEIPYQKQQQKGSVFVQIPFQQFKQYNGDLFLSIAQMTLDKKSVTLPAYITEYFNQKRGGIAFNSIQNINLWYYKGERISTWHYDGHDNFLFVQQGQKKIYLMPINQVKPQFINYVESKSVFDENSNHAIKYNLKERNHQIYSVTVKAGQCLFIPRGWWHQVHSQGRPNIALNVWGNSIKKQIGKGEEDIFLKHIIYEISEQLSKSIPNWQQSSIQMKQTLRQVNFMLYFNKYLRKVELTARESSDS